METRIESRVDTGGPDGFAGGNVPREDVVDPGALARDAQADGRRCPGDRRRRRASRSRRRRCTRPRSPRWSSCRPRPSGSRSRRWCPCRLDASGAVGRTDRDVSRETEKRPEHAAHPSQASGRWWPCPGAAGIARASPRSSGTRAGSDPRAPSYGMTVMTSSGSSPTIRGRARPPPTSPRRRRTLPRDEMPTQLEQRRRVLDEDGQGGQRHGQRPRRAAPDHSSTRAWTAGDVGQRSLISTASPGSGSGGSRSRRARRGHQGALPRGRRRGASPRRTEVGDAASSGDIREFDRAERVGHVPPTASAGSRTVVDAVGSVTSSSRIPPAIRRHAPARRLEQPHVKRPGLRSDDRGGAEGLLRFNLQRRDDQVSIRVGAFGVRLDVLAVLEVLVRRSCARRAHRVERDGRPESAAFSAASSAWRWSAAPDAHGSRGVETTRTPADGGDGHVAHLNARCWTASIVCPWRR